MNKDHKTLLYRVLLGVLIKLTLATDGTVWFVKVENGITAYQGFTVCLVEMPNGNRMIDLTVLWVSLTVAWVGLSRKNLWGRVEP